jgi:SseB protein N-terminal domain
VQCRKTTTFDRDASRKETTIQEPPVDLDKPVENPELVAQIIRGRQSGTDADLRVTLQMLRGAVFLLATQITHPDGDPAIVDGMMRAGTVIKLHTVRLRDDRSALAVFTDWPSLRAAVGDGADWSSIVQTGDDVFALATRPEYPGGVVVDPSGPEVTFAMDPAQIAWMRANTRPAG